MALIIPVFTIYESINPNEYSEVVLSEYPNYFVVPTGGTYQGRWTKRQYVLIPSGLSMPTLLSIDLKNLHEIKSDTDMLGFWVVLGLFCFGWFMLYSYISRLVKYLRN